MSMEVRHVLSPNITLGSAHAYLAHSDNNQHKRVPGVFEPTDHLNFKRYSPMSL